jgi:hypothetical protein
MGCRFTLFRVLGLRPFCPKRLDNCRNEQAPSVPYLSV